MKLVLQSALLLSLASLVCAQSVPSDANHLPKKIGGDDSLNNRVDSTTVAGKISLRDLPPDKPRPSVAIAVYNQGRLVTRRNVPENGSYTISDVPREGSTIILEIDRIEVETRQILPGPAMIIYQDFQVSLLQASQKVKPAVINAPTYERSLKNQQNFDKAVAEIGGGRTDGAINLLETIIATDPRDFAAWTQLGNAYFLKKEHAKAEDAYVKATSLTETFAPALINLGRLYLTQNKNEEAITVLSRAVVVEPRSADAQHMLGEGYLALKKGSKAVVYLNEAIRLAPIEKAEIHLRLAALYNAAGLKSRASAEYKQYLEKVPNTERRDELKKYISENPPSQ